LGEFAAAATLVKKGLATNKPDIKEGATRLNDAVQEIAQSASERDPHGYRAEFLELVRLAKQLTGEQPAPAAEPSTAEGP
jgi:hypothetical protein